MPINYRKNKILQHKRKLIVRDWFFYVVWKMRLKKITQNLNSKPVLDNYLFFDPKYSEILKKCLDERVQFEEIRQTFTEKIVKNDLHSFCI